MSVFVSVASHRDAVLSFTLTQAYEKAAWPDELVFGVVDQNLAPGLASLPIQIPRSQIRYVFIPAEQTRGCCWARSIAMSLVADEDWFLQIDSHTFFEQDWDARLIDQANALMATEPNCVLTSYPPGFRFAEDGTPVPVDKGDVLRAHVVAPDSTFEGTDPVLRFTTRALDGFAAVEGFHIAAGALFASADFVQNFPWDPYLYFNEEEPSMALRLFTSGWTIFHVKDVPLYHLYNHPSAAQPARELPWTPDVAATSLQDEPLWSVLTKRARARMNVLVSDDSSALGVYGLGEERSLKDYAKECGIDYLNRRVSPKAYAGPWISTPAPRPTA